MHTIETPNTGIDTPSPVAISAESETGISRRRIRFADADTIRGRVQDAAEDANLRGARAHVLNAVLGLLCRWARIHDDQVRIHQIAALLAPENRCDAKTIGRALKALTAARFISYKPAQGRGRTATIAIDRRFLDGIAELDRGPDGRVVVTFSEARSLYLSKNNYPPTPRPTADHHRPTEVNFDPAELTEILANLPDAYSGLPRHLRWALGKEARGALARGWRSDQILDVLAAPAPAGLTKPFRLAKWRLGKNLVGSGPRLAPAQRAWDDAHRSAETVRVTDREARRTADIHAITTPSTRTRLLNALRSRLRMTTLVDEAAALRHAAVLATRDLPGLTLAEAINQWLAHNDASTPPPPAPVAPEAPDSTCACCAERDGVIRPQLLLPTFVCDHCWSTAAVDAA